MVTYDLLQVPESPLKNRRWSISIYLKLFFYNVYSVALFQASLSLMWNGNEEHLQRCS